MRSALPLVALLVLMASCSAPPPRPAAQPFTPGVEGRSAAETCQTTSPECQRWTELARKCEEGLRQREQGYMGYQRPYCTEAESYREQVTGVPLSTSPGAYSF